MISIFQQVGQFLFLWFVMCGLWHDAMHLLECKRQGGFGHMIILFDPLPSMRYSCEDVPDDDMRNLAGGLYSGLTCLLLALIFPFQFIRWIFLTLALVQFTYGYFEMKYINSLSSKKYWLGRYSIYVSIVFVMMLIYYFMR